MSNWQVCDAIHDSHLLPRCPAVYLIQIDGITVYVGQSLRLRGRIYSHKFRYGYGKNIILPWCDIDLPSEITLKYKVSKVVGDWAMWEIRLIHKLKPIYNRAYLKSLQGYIK